MEKDINTEVSNTQLPATEEKANLKESLRIQKSQWIKEQIKRQREAEDAVLEQMIEEQRVIDGLNSDINENLDRLSLVRSRFSLMSLFKPSMRIWTGRERAGSSIRSFRRRSILRFTR